MSYTPRTTQPSDDDLRFRSNDGLEGSNGYNNFPNVRARWGGLSPYLGSVLANCTGYCQGRWMELGNTNTPYAFHGNAGDWINEAIQAGYATGSEPQPGAIVVFAGWSSNSAGHVAVVEEISDDGSYIKCSESNYGSTIFEWPVYRYRDTGWKRKGSSSGASIGFVYHPNISPPEPIYTLSVVNGHADSYVGHPTNRTSIYADVPSGYRFKKWIVNGAGYIDNVNQPVAVFEFGDGDCTIEATFVKFSSIKVVNGKADIYTADAGTITKIYANLPSGGFKFYKWIASTTNGTIANPNIMNTTFTFGNGDNTITALYRKIDSLSLMYYISPVSLRRRM